MTTDFNLLRCRLESERKHLIEELEQLNVTVRQAGERREGNPLDIEEEAAEMFELEKCLVLQKRIIERLKDVEQALRKFADGTYGLCENCGQQIDPARLEALPKASLCLSCKGLQVMSAKGRSSTGSGMRILPWVYS